MAGDVIPTDHAVERLRQRGVDWRDIVEVVLHPEWTTPARNNCRRYHGTIAGRRVSVIVAEDGSDLRVVTVYWD